jgi:single-strand DNA-binding protein
MPSYNRVTLLGNLGGDPELRYTNGKPSKAVCNMTVATSWKPKAGPEQTEWHRIVAWEANAENCAKFLKKGSQVFVDGRLANRKWEKDGIKHVTTEVVADRVMFLGVRAAGGAGPAAAAGSDGPDVSDYQDF